MIGTLAKQTAIYGVSSIVARLLNYLLMPFLTRILSTSEYGVVGDMYAIIPFALVILTFGMETAYFKFAGDAKDQTQKSKVFSSSWLSVSSLALLFLGGVMLFLEPISSAMGYASNTNYVALVAGIIVLDVISAVPFARLRQQGKAVRFVMVRVLSVLINVTLCVYFYAFMSSESVDVSYVFWANLIASFVALVFVIPFRELSFKIDSKLLAVMLLYSLPLVLSGIAGTANEFIDRQMIKYLMPSDIALSSLGIYSAVVKIGVILLLFTQMYRIAAEPFFLSGFKKEDFKATNAEALKYFMIVSIAIFLGITLFSPLFALLVGEDFREGMNILPVVLLANIFSGVVLNLSFWYKKEGKTKYAFYVTGIGLIFTIALNIVLIPVLGFMGAALARLACEAVMVAVSYYLNRKYYPTPYDLRSVGLYCLIGAAIYFAHLFTDSLDSAIKYSIHLLLLLSFAIFALKKEKIKLNKLWKLK